VDSDQARTRRFPVIRASVSVNLPLVGLEMERKRIETALRRGESLLVLGPRGCGKTCLLRECSSAVPGTAFVEYSTNLHRLLQTLASALADAGHERIRHSLMDGTKQTSVHLRGILWNALEKQPARIVLDGVHSASFPVLRVFQRSYFMRGMSIVASARDAMELGALGRLFWDPRLLLQLKPLNDAAAAQLFERAVHVCGLAVPNLGEFRRRVLAAAAGNAGQIVEMCRLASKPEYRTATGRIKFELVRIDCLVSTVG
jgi:hypothetical protein